VSNAFAGFSSPPGLSRRRERGNGVEAFVRVPPPYPLPQAGEGTLGVVAFAYLTTCSNPSAKIVSAAMLSTMLMSSSWIFVEPDAAALFDWKRRVWLLPSA